MTIGNDRILQVRETNHLKLQLHKDGAYYHVNAWGRSSRRAAWRQIWHSRVYLSYLRALNEYNDTGQALYDWKNQINVSGMVA